MAVEVVIPLRPEPVQVIVGPPGESVAITGTSTAEGATTATLTAARLETGTTGAEGTTAATMVAARLETGTNDAVSLTEVEIEFGGSVPTGRELTGTNEAESRTQMEVLFARLETGTNGAESTNAAAVTFARPVTGETGGESETAVEYQSTNSLAILENTLPNAVRGQAYQAEITVLGAYEGPPTCAVVVGNPPAGITLLPHGTFVGTPTGSTETFTVRAEATISNQNGQSVVIAVEKTFTMGVVVVPFLEGGGIVVSAPSEITISPNDFITLQLLATSAEGPVSWFIETGDPPIGISIIDTGLLLGQAEELGDHVILFRLEDGVSDPVFHQLTIHVIEIGQILITTSALPPAQMGEPYDPFQLLAVGATGEPILWSLTPTSPPLPTGMPLSTNGFLSGNPTQYGDFLGIEFQAVHRPDLPGIRKLDLHVAPPIAMINVTSPVQGGSYGAGTALSIAWTATNLVVAPSWLLFVMVDDVIVHSQPLAPTLVPPGNQLNGNYAAMFTIPATIQAGSQYNVVVKDDVSNALGGSGNFSVTAYTQLTITTPAALPNATQGAAYGPVALAYTGGVGTPTWGLASGVSLPNGVTFVNGVFGGNPTVFGTFANLTVTLADGVGPPTSKTFTLVIAATGQIVFVTGSLPPATVGVVYPGQQLVVSGNQGPVTFTKVGGSADVTVTTGGVVNVATQSNQGTLTITVLAEDGIVNSAQHTFTIIVTGVLAAGTYQRVFRDGTVLIAGQGCNAVLVQGSTGNPDVTVAPFYSLSQPFNIAVGSLNAPGGMPDGVQVSVLVDANGEVDIDIYGRGTSDGLFAGNEVTSGNPLYFQGSECFFPGRAMPLDIQYRGVTEPEPGHFILVRPTDLKHPARYHTSTNQLGTANPKYTPSLTNHFTDGGESEHWHLVLAADPLSTASLPSSQAVEEVLELFEVNETRIAAWPKLPKLLEQYQHDPANYLNEFAADGTKKITWMLDYTNLINRGSEAGTPGGGVPPVLGPPPPLGSGNSIYAYFQQYAELHNWHAGLHITTPADQGHNPIRLGYYGGPAFMGIQYARNPAAANAVESLQYFCAMVERIIQVGLLRYGPSAPVTYKNVFRDEGTNFFTEVNPATGLVQKFFAKTGMGGGGGQAPTYGKQVMDLPTISAYLLKGRGPNARPLFADAFNRRTSELVTSPNQGWAANAGGNANPNQGLRSPGNYLRALYWYFKAHVLLGNMSTAAQLKAKASAIIGSMFTTIDQAAASVLGGGVAPLWTPITNNPTVTPLTNSQMEVNISEGIYLYITKWMQESGNIDGTGVHVQPSRLAFWKQMCDWYFRYTTFDSGGGPANPTRNLAYRFFPDMSGGGATWNNPPGIANQTYFHAAWTLGMEKYMTLWFPGAVGPSGLTWAEVFTRLARFGLGQPAYPGWPQYQTSTLDCENGHTGSDNIWCMKHMNIFSHAALWD